MNPKSKSEEEEGELEKTMPTRRNPRVEGSRQKRKGSNLPTGISYKNPNKR